MNSNNNYNTSDEVRKDYIWMLIGVFVLGVFLGVALACVAYIGSASAETVPEERWAICQPDSYLNIREKPKKTANIGGWLYLGDRVETDGKMQNGYLHIVNASTESGDGWVAARYLMEDKQVSISDEALENADYNDDGWLTLEDLTRVLNQLSAK